MEKHNKNQLKREEAKKATDVRKLSMNKPKVKAKILAFSIAMIGSLAVGEQFVFLADKSPAKILYRVTGKTYRAMYIIQVGDDVDTPTPVPVSIAVMKMPGN